MKKKELSSLEIYYLMKEFQQIINSKIDKIYQLSNKELDIQLHIPNKGKKILRIILPGLIWLSDFKKDYPSTPPGFCTYLRKKIGGGRIREVKQHNFERIIKVEITTKDSLFTLIIELFGAGNIILTENDKVLSAVLYHKWKDRTIRPGIIYEYPPPMPDPAKLSFEEFKSILKASKQQEIVKKIAVELGMGGLFAEEICIIAKVDKTSKEITEKQAEALYKALKRILSMKVTPIIIKEGDEIINVLPFKLNNIKSHKIIEKKTICEALDEVFIKEYAKQKLSKLSSKQNEQLKKLERMIKAQKTAIENIKKEIEINTKKGELIYKNYALVDSVIKELLKARKKYSWKEIKEKLKNHKIIKEIREKDNSIIIELS